MIGSDGLEGVNGWSDSRRSPQPIALAGSVEVDGQHSKRYDCGRTAGAVTGKGLNGEFC